MNKYHCTFMAIPFTGDARTVIHDVQAEHLDHAENLLMDYVDSYDVLWLPGTFGQDWYDQTWDEGFTLHDTGDVRRVAHSINGRCFILIEKVTA